MNSLNMTQIGKWFIAGCVLLMSIPALAAHPYAEWADELGIDLNASYDGTRVMETKDGSIEFVEHKAPQKMYTLIEMSGITSGIILREDLGKGYLLMPSMGMYRETSLEDGIMQGSNDMEFKSIEKVGRDEVLGFPSSKYKTRFKDKDGKGEGFIWVTDGGVPIKMDMTYTSRGEKGMRLTMEFNELNMRQQDPAIFELPEDLKPMNLGGLGNLGDILSGAQGNGGTRAATSRPAAAPASSMSKQLTTDDMTQSVQLHLQHLGIDPGDTGGDLTLHTQIAISEFQATKGMKVTGEVSPQLLGVLSAEVDSGQ